MVGTIQINDQILLQLFLFVNKPKSIHVFKLFSLQGCNLCEFSLLQFVQINILERNKLLPSHSFNQDIVLIQSYFYVALKPISTQMQILLEPVLKYALALSFKLLLIVHTYFLIFFFFSSFLIYTLQKTEVEPFFDWYVKYFNILMHNSRIVVPKMLLCLQLSFPYRFKNGLELLEDLLQILRMNVWVKQHIPQISMKHLQFLKEVMRVFVCPLLNDLFQLLEDVFLNLLPQYNKKRLMVMLVQFDKSPIYVNKMLDVVFLTLFYYPQHIYTAMVHQLF